MEKGPSADNASPAVLAGAVEPDEELEELDELDFEVFLLWAKDRAEPRQSVPRRRMVAGAESRFITVASDLLTQNRDFRCDSLEQGGRRSPSAEKNLEDGRAWRRLRRNRIQQGGFHSIG
jgi:hypothetical protein